MIWSKVEITPLDKGSQRKETPENTSSGEIDAKSLRERAQERAEQVDLSAFPKEMSCMTCLDELMTCMSLGGQVRHYYRYGDLTTCDRANEKLNFCFSQTMTDLAKREKAVQQFYKDRLVADMARGSSEDIWEAR